MNLHLANNCHYFTSFKLSGKLGECLIVPGRVEVLLCHEECQKCKYFHVFKPNTTLINFENKRNLSNRNCIYRGVPYCVTSWLSSPGRVEVLLLCREESKVSSEYNARQEKYVFKLGWFVPKKTWDASSRAKCCFE